MFDGVMFDGTEGGYAPTLRPEADPPPPATVNPTVQVREARSATFTLPP